MVDTEEFKYNSKFDFSEFSRLMNKESEDESVIMLKEQMSQLLTTIEYGQYSGKISGFISQTVLLEIKS